MFCDGLPLSMNRYQRCSSISPKSCCLMLFEEISKPHSVLRPEEKYGLSGLFPSWWSWLNRARADLSIYIQVGKCLLLFFLFQFFFENAWSMYVFVFKPQSQLRDWLIIMSSSFFGYQQIHGRLYLLEIVRVRVFTLTSKHLKISFLWSDHLTKKKLLAVNTSWMLGLRL